MKRYGRLTQKNGWFGLSLIIFIIGIECVMLMGAPTARAAEKKSAAAFKKEKIAVDGMECPDCPMKIVSEVYKLKGVFAVTVVEKDIEVTYDTNQTSTDQIRSAIKDGVKKIKEEKAGQKDKKKK